MLNVYPMQLYKKTVCQNFKSLKIFLDFAGGHSWGENDHVFAYFWGVCRLRRVEKQNAFPLKLWQLVAYSTTTQWKNIAEFAFLFS